MVLQRWQSVYLLVGFFAMILACFLPFGALKPEEEIIQKLVPKDYSVLLILNVLISALLLLDIFLYKNLRFQKLIAAVCAMLCIASIITQIIILVRAEANFNLVWNGSLICVLCAFICSMMARFNIKRDEKLLRSYDRIR